MFLSLLISSYADDSSLQNQQVAQQYLSMIIEQEQEDGKWIDTSLPLFSQFIESVIQSGKIAQHICGGSSFTGVSLHKSFTLKDSSNSFRALAHHNLTGDFNHDEEGKLLQLLSTAIGCGMILSSVQDTMLKSNMSLIARTMQVLFIPDLKYGQKHMILESRRYYQPVSNKPVTETYLAYVDGGYYSLPLLSTRSSSCNRALRRLSSLLGRLGIISNLNEMLMDNINKLESCQIANSNSNHQVLRRKLKNTHDSQVNGSNLELEVPVSEYVLQKLRIAISIWSIIKYGLLGLIDIVQISNSSADKILEECEVCGTVDKVSRCSRCKKVFYCSAAHQKQDWMHHKVSIAFLSVYNKVAKIFDIIVIHVL
jgi:hypothetical protein